jgi:hypothetical protein
MNDGSAFAPLIDAGIAARRSTCATDPERARIAESTADQPGPWWTVGPYLSERAWGTVREDHSADGRAWDLFHEYFHGETGEGLGASHQTGWTALVAALVAERARRVHPGREPV